MIDVGESRLAQRPQCLPLYDHHVLAHHLLDLDAVDIEHAIGGLVRSKREQRGVMIRRRAWRRDGSVHGSAERCDDRGRLCYFSAPYKPTRVVAKKLRFK